MTLIILDPNLEGEAGHHLAYDLAIAKAAMARGEAVTIVANRRFGATAIEGVRILPHFTETCYAVRHSDPVTGAFDDFRHFNDTLQAELALLPRSGFRPTDAVLVPTVTETHLAGHVGWMKGFDPLEAPLFVVHLMLPSGVAADAGQAPRVEEPLRALFYRLAERAAQEAGPPVHLFASGGQHAAEYGALFGREIAPHPLPILHEPALAATERPRRALLFAGDARLDKGVALLPELVPALAAAHPDWRFVAHVNGNAAWGPAQEAAAALAALAPEVPNLDLSGGRLAAEDYAALLQGCAIALFPYDPALYRRKSSGVLWEAVSLGTPVVVPEGTWLENEARHWGAGHVGYAGHSAGAILGAFAAALPRIAELAARSEAAGARYRAANGADALIDQIAALWVRHKAATSLVTRPQGGAIDLARLRTGWHRPESADGTPIRWSMQEPVVEFDWPFAEGWEVEFTLQAFFGTEQLDRIEAVAGGAEAEVSWSRAGRGALLLVRGAGPGRARPRVELRLRLPHTYRPVNEARDLGVLVTAIRLGPAARPRAAAAQGGPAARVLSAPEAGGGWRLDPAVSGEILPPAEDGACTLAFRLRGGSVGMLRSLALFVNGVPQPLTVSAESGGAWLATASLPPALLRQAAMPAWDLICEAPEAAAPPLLLREARAAPMAGGGMAATEAAVAEAAVAEAAMAAAVVAEAAVAAADPAAPRLRWDRSTGVGLEEGPFVEFGIPAGVRWVVAREARLVVEAGGAETVRLRLLYRSLVLRQSLRVAVNGGPPSLLEMPGGKLSEQGEATLRLDLRPGMNEVALTFAGAVREPGSGRELVLLIEQAGFLPGE